MKNDANIRELSTILIRLKTEWERDKIRPTPAIIAAALDGVGVSAFLIPRVVHTALESMKKGTLVFQNGLMNHISESPVFVHSRPVGRLGRDVVTNEPVGEWDIEELP